MTRRASLTQAQIQRAIRAAKAEGVVALVLPDAIAFVESDKLPLPVPEQGRVNSCDNAFGKAP
jgi:hypothetical protein